MNDRPAIAVLGVGAIGGAVAAALGDAGHRPALCVRTPFQHLSRSLDGETRQYEHPVYTRCDALSHQDWVLLCTKAHQIEGAAHWLRRLIGPDTRVAVMQNGVDHVDRVSAYVDAERAVPCVIMLPAHAVQAGVVEQARAGTVQVPDSAAGRALAELFADQQAIGFEPSADFVSALWSKLVSNAVGGAICALALKPLGAVAAAQVRELVTGLMEEVVRVGQAEGAIFPEDFVAEMIQKFCGPIGEHWTSIAADRRDGRSMEWQARNAVVGVVGRRHGIPTPLNDALTALLALIDAPTA
ncbi:MAG: 2-dehydropantoate 2-reductase [Gammaproteobacteria bacterium]|nr:2-dehydropantoate 2-reductase [Gammaproteobacteria bacterium]MDX2462476.1 2-dehydropantoate 2-reductase [Gammaproteobacteria bacterium]